MDLSTTTVTQAESACHDLDSPKQGNCLTSLRISFLTWTWGMYCLTTGVCSAVPSRQCRQRWAWYLLLLKPHSVVVFSSAFLKPYTGAITGNIFTHLVLLHPIAAAPPHPLFLLVFPTTFSFSVTELLKIVYVAIAGVLCLIHTVCDRADTFYFLHSWDTWSWKSGLLGRGLVTISVADAYLLS